MKVAASSSTPLFKTLKTIWRFQPASPQSSHPTNQVPVGLPLAPRDASDRSDAGPTLVTLDLAFAFTNPMHNALAATVFGQVSKLIVKAFEERLVQLYGTGEQ